VCVCVRKREREREREKRPNQLFLIIHTPVLQLMNQVCTECLPCTEHNAASTVHPILFSHQNHPVVHTLNFPYEHVHLKLCHQIQISLPVPNLKTRFPTIKMHIHI
jgi:hypothetical protein